MQQPRQHACPLSPAVHEVRRDKLQLVGVTAMLIASKFEEIYAPEVRDFVYITDNVSVCTGLASPSQLSSGT